MLFYAHEIEARMTELFDEQEAIVAVAAKDDRTPNEDETAKIDEIDGEIKTLETKLTAARAREEAKLKLAQTRGTQIIKDNIGDTDDIFANVTVPARAKRHGKMTAFKDEKDAYVSGLFFASTIYGHEPSKNRLADMGYDFRAAMSEGTDSAGGYAVPDITEATIILIAEENGVLRRFARPTVMSSDVHNVPVRTAGLTVYYPAENAAITASDLTLDRAQLTAKLYATITEVSGQLNEDALVSMADELATNIGLAFALAEDTNGFIGDGTSTYASVTGLDSALNANSIYTASAGNISWATLDLADFEETAAKLPRFGGANPAWFIHSAGYFNAMVRLMNASGGTPGSEVASGYNATFLGYPVVFTQVLPSAPGVSENVCFFGDLSQSVYMGTRTGISVASDMGGKYFEKNQIAVRGTERVAITVQNQDSSAAGPVVALATPGA